MVYYILLKIEFSGKVFRNFNYRYSRCSMSLYEKRHDFPFSVECLSFAAILFSKTLAKMLVMLVAKMSVIFCLFTCRMCLSSDQIRKD